MKGYTTMKNIEEQILILEQKIDIVLGILGYGRTKSHTQIQREAGETVERLHLMALQRKKKKEEAAKHGTN